MPVSPTLKKALLAGAAAAAFGGGLYWKFAPAAPPADDSGTTPLARLSVDQLGPVSPSDRDVLARAERLIQQGRLPDAVAVLNEFRDTDGRPAHLRAVLYVGYCQLRLGNLPEAERAFGYVAVHRPGEPDAHRGLAEVYEFLGAAPLAEGHLKRVAELDPADYRPHHQLAASYLEMKFFEPAEASLREALKRNPPADAAAVIRRELAEALIGRKQFGEALAAVPPGDDAPAARAIRAECQRMLNRPADAAKEVEAGLAASPTDPKVRGRLLVERGWLLVDRRDDAGAAKAFEEALKLDEHNLTARMQLGLALRRLGDGTRADAEQAKFKDSEARLDRVTKLTQQANERPWDAAVRRELADACRNLNLSEMADHWLKAAAVCEAAKK